MTRPPSPLDGHRLREDTVSAAATQEITVGQRRLHALSDGLILMQPAAVGTLTEPTAGYDSLAADYAEVRLPIGCFVWPGERNALIDVGFGPRDIGEVAGGGFLAGLAHLGLEPADIEIVALSHLHFDHAGGIADPVSGQPTFPNAQIYVDRRDWEYFVEGDGGALPIEPYMRLALLDLHQHGQISLETEDRMIAPGINRIAAPGHTPGHSAYLIHDAADRVILLGDAMHCPQQLTNQQWGSAFDVDPALARASRDRITDDLAVHGGRVIGCHFPGLRPENLPPVSGTSHGHGSHRDGPRSQTSAIEHR